MPSLRYYFTLALSLLAISLTSAQVPDPGIAAQAPVPGAGHQYIGFGAETVNPADGSLTFDLPFSPPTGRQLSFPFGIRYSPAEQFSLNTQVSSSLSWSPIQGPPFQINGWAYLLPTYTFQTFNLSSTPDPNHFGSFLYCDASRNYVFRGFDSTQRSMGIGNVWPDPSNTSTINCGTGSMSASRHGWNFSTPSFTPSANQPPINVTDPSGTVYAFPQGPGVASSIGSILVFGLFAQTITDRNGNQISFTGNQSNGSPPSSGGYKDTLGRTVVSWSGLGTAAGDQLTISGLSSNIVVHWTTKSVTFPENGHDVQHNVVPCTLTPNSSGPDTIQVVSEIDLPTTTTAQRYFFHTTQFTVELPRLPFLLAATFAMFGG